MDKEMIDSIILVVASLCGGVTLTALITEWGSTRKVSVLHVVNLCVSSILMLIVLFNVRIDIQFIGF